jgi:hypothetical protein
MILKMKTNLMMISSKKILIANLYIGRNV